MTKVKTIFGDDTEVQITIGSCVLVLTDAVGDGAIGLAVRYSGDLLAYAEIDASCMQVTVQSDSYAVAVDRAQ